MLTYIYTLFVGILLALFVGVGIAAFYKAPKSPEYPPALNYPLPPADYAKEKSVSSRLQKQRDDFDRRQKAYQETFEKYQRNVSIISLVAAILLLVISLTIFRNLLMIADGFLLGGVFTLIYSIIRGFQTTDTMFRFVVVSVGLVVAMTLGYIKFIKPVER